MPLRSWFVVTPAFREREAVMDPRVELDLAWRARPLEQRAQLIDHWQGCQLVVFGAGNIQLPFDLPL